MEPLANALDSTLSAGEIAVRMALATLLAAIIGVNREWRNKPAGLKTHILVSLGACTFAILALEMVHDTLAIHPDSQPDPIRIIEAVVKGVAFLGAGVIIHARGNVQGLTTGASLLMAGAIGTAAGVGHALLALLGMLFALLVLTVVRALEIKAFPAEKEGGREGGREP